MSPVARSSRTKSLQAQRRLERALAPDVDGGMARAFESIRFAARGRSGGPVDDQNSTAGLPARLPPRSIPARRGRERLEGGL